MHELLKVYIKKNLPLLLILNTLFAQTLFAGTMGKASKTWSGVGSLSLGPIWAQGVKTQTIPLTPDIEYTLVPNKTRTALLDGEVFIGLQKNLSNHLFSYGQFGLALATASSAKFRGVIWDDSEAQFDNYAYQYKIQHSYLALKGKILSDLTMTLKPWISGSVGLGLNRAYSYQNIPLIYEALPRPNFGSHTQTTFSYALGAGVQRILDDHWQIGLGYDFSYWGKSTLNGSSEQTVPSRIALSHIYTNGVLFNLTYLS